MTIPASVLRRLDLAKTLAIEITTPHKVDRVALAPVTVVLRVSDARHLRDEGDMFLTRLEAGYQLEESTGARNPPNANQVGQLPRGTGIKGGTEANRFTFSVSNRRGPDGSTLDDWRDYQLTGSEVVVYRGAERDGDGNPYEFSDYDEVFYGRLRTAKRGQESWEFQAESPEGWSQERKLVRRPYLGHGYGIELDSTGGGGAVDAWLDVTSSAFVPTSGAWAFSTIMTLLAVPTGVEVATIFTYSARLFVRFRAAGAGPTVEVVHDDGAGAVTFVFPDYNFTIGTSRPFMIGVDYDATATHPRLYLYVDGEQVSSVLTTKDPAADATVFRIGRGAPDVNPLSARIWEFWLSDDSIGAEEMRTRQAGPLEYDRASQGDLWQLYKFLEGSVSIGALLTESHDLIFDGAENDLTFQGTADYVQSEEGDKPTVEGSPRGDSWPYILSTVFNFPPAFQSRAGLQGPKPIYRASSQSTAINAARLDGLPLRIGYSETGVFRLRTNLGSLNRSAIESTALARLAFGPLVSAEGTELRQGSEIEISGGHAEDGIWFCTGIEGGLFVFVNDGQGRPYAQLGADQAVGGFSAEDLAASITIDMPAAANPDEVTDIGDGTLTTVDLFTGQLTVDATTSAPVTTTAPTSLVWLKDVRDRAEGTEIDDVLFTSGSDVTWVGPVGERDTPWSLGIPSGGDLAYQQALSTLLESYFAWSTDAPRVAGVEKVRAGHYRPPDGSGTVFDASLVEEETIVEMDTLPPAWRVVVLYAPNYAPIAEGRIPAVVSPSMRKRLAQDFSELEVFRDEEVLSNFDKAREVFWRTNVSTVVEAARLGRRLADFLKVPRTWWSYLLMARPEDILIGDEISVPHARFLDAGTDGMIVLGKTHGITDRGVDLVVVSGSVFDIKAAPENLSVITGDTEATLTWDAINGAAGYNLYFSTLALPALVPGSPIAGTSFVHTGLTNGLLHTWTVRALNGNGDESADSSEASGTPAP